VIAHRRLTVPRIDAIYLSSTSPDLISRITSTGAFDDSPHQRPNHVILNEVRPRHRAV